MQRFTDLKVWQRSHDLAEEIYLLANSFPDERYGLTSQLKRAVVSISNNIAEGSKRKSHQDYARFLNMAEGSAAEVENMLILAQRVKLATPEQIAPLISTLNEISRMLHAYRQKVESSSD